MHATTTKRKEKTLFNLNIKERAFNVQTMIMMAARTSRIGDKRRKLRKRDDRRIEA
jgi:hypothetical protein